MILAGDLGGTKCNLGLFRERDGGLELLVSRRYPTREYAKRSFEAVLKNFSEYAATANGDLSKEKIVAAGFGAAGAVIEGVLHPTYVPWALEAKKLGSHLGIKSVRLLNDVEAAAFSLPHLRGQDVVNLNEVQAPMRSTRALIAAGTGLGEAVLFWTGKRYHALPTEGGEADFAPATEQEIELLRFARKRMERVAEEEIVSGSGFRLIHEFLDGSVRHESFSKPAWDAAQEITQNAASGVCAVCRNTVEVWIAAYASEAGNLALRTLAWGGIYVGGGIAPKILPQLKEFNFAGSFVSKGRFAEMLGRIPLYVVVNQDAPLWGAAYEALAAAQN
jgi:glucokinase